MGMASAHTYTYMMSCHEYTACTCINICTHIVHMHLCTCAHAALHACNDVCSMQAVHFCLCECDFCINLYCTHGFCNENILMSLSWPDKRNNAFSMETEVIHSI